MKTTTTESAISAYREARKALPAVNGYTVHRTVTVDGHCTYEMPVSYIVKKTARGGWWGVATYADGHVEKAFRKTPCRIIPVNL